MLQAYYGTDVEVEVAIMSCFRALRFDVKLYSGLGLFLLCTVAICFYFTIMYDIPSSNYIGHRRIYSEGYVRDWITPARNGSVYHTPCTDLSLSPTPLPITALASFPGSGNTWIRHLIQEVTGP